MKKVIFDKKEINNNEKLSKINSENIRKKIETYKEKNDISNNSIFEKDQFVYIKNIYNNIIFKERALIISELKAKINSYKQQDNKKDFHEEGNYITLDKTIFKLYDCKLKCYYCNKNMMILFDKVRDKDQWTLDRINNYDDHNDLNTVICCLECNLQRRRKNSEKFKFSKQLETKQLVINKIQ